MKIMEAGKPSIQDSFAHARELKVIHEDRKKGSTVGNIGAQDNNDDDLDDEEEDSHINNEGNHRTTRANNPVQEILNRDNKANNNNSNLLQQMQILPNPRSPSEGLS